MKYLLLLLLLVACSEAPTPARRMELAAAAMREADHAGALKLYRKLLDENGSRAASQDLRFRASLRSVECLVELGRSDEAVASYLGLVDTFTEEMTTGNAYRYTRDVIDSLARTRAAARHYTALLDHAARAHPRVLERFQSYVRRIADQNRPREVVIDEAIIEELLDSVWPDALLFPEDVPPEPVFDDSER